MKWILRIILMPFLLFFLESCYLVKNAYQFTSLYNSRRDIDEVLKDEKVHEKTKKKLQQVRAILAYAKEEGLNTEDKYTQYIEVGDRPISYIVEAAEVDQLVNVMWWFPIVGSVPYLGYFEKEERDEKAKLLKEKGYDVYETEASAFSGLGWIRDPILSSYLSGTEASLANLLFHELTHATLWISGSADFNENLASYVADILTIQYLQSTKQVDELDNYYKKKADRELFSKWLEDLRKSLDELYSQRGVLLADQIKKRKQEVFSRFLKERRPKFKSVDYIGHETWNNAYVLGASLYVAKMDEFEKARACLGNIGIGPYLSKIKEESKNIDDPFKILKGFCVKSGEKK